MKTEISDIEVIDQVLDGNQQVFAVLVERYQRVIAKTIYGMLGDVPEADDVGQEVFIRFFKSLKEFRGESSLATYLTRIAINLSLNELKKRKRKDSFFFYKEHNHEVKQTDVADEGDVYEDYDNSELIASALDQLDAKSRSIVVVRLIQGYSTKETAQMLNIPIGTVLSRLARSQDKLKGILTKLMQEAPQKQGLV